MSDDLHAALARLARLDGVPEAAARAVDAVTALRWHEGLRRRWREARAETAVRSAVAGAAVEGARVDAGWLRARVATGDVAPTGDAAGDLALAVWRAQVHAGELFGDLGGRGRPPAVPTAEIVAGLHRDLTAHLVPQVPAESVGRPRAGEQPRESGPAGGGEPPLGGELVARLDQVLAVADAEGAPALARVAVVHGELATLRPFLTANGQLARVVARLLAVRTGLEPTGVAVLDSLAADDVAGYRHALAGYATGTPEGVAAWLRYQAAAVETGARAGAEVAGAVLAGRTG